MVRAHQHRRTLATAAGGGSFAIRHINTQRTIIWIVDPCPLDRTPTTLQDGATGTSLRNSHLVSTPTRMLPGALHLAGCQAHGSFLLATVVYPRAGYTLTIQTQMLDWPVNPILRRSSSMSLKTLVPTGRRHCRPRPHLSRISFKTKPSMDTKSRFLNHPTLWLQSAHRLTP